MYIYKITHKSTHQAYVGQTQDFIERWKKHLTDNSSPIQKALKQEGAAAFTFEVLEVCSPEMANQRETFWINYYRTYETGYNTNNGEGASLEESYVEAPTKPSIAEVKRGAVNSPDGVDAYDPRTGALVAHYPSIAEANRTLGKEGTGNISAVCRGRGRTAYGYIWRYTTPQSN